MNNTTTPAATPRATPRTDDAVCFMASGPAVVFAGFARTLERESAAQSDLIAEMERALEETSVFWQAVAFHYGKDNLCKDVETRALAIRDAALHRAREAKKGGV